MSTNKMKGVLKNAILLLLTTMTGFIIAFFGVSLPSLAAEDSDNGGGGGGGGANGDSLDVSWGIEYGESAIVPPRQSTSTAEPGIAPPPDPLSYTFWVPCSNAWEPETVCNINQEHIYEALSNKASQLKSAGSAVPDGRIAAVGDSWGVNANTTQDIITYTAFLRGVPDGTYSGNGVSAGNSVYRYPYTNTGTNCGFDGQVPCATKTPVSSTTCSPVYDGYDSRNGRMMATGKWYTVQVQQAKVAELMSYVAVLEAPSRSRIYNTTVATGIAATGWVGTIAVNAGFGLEGREYTTGTLGELATGGGFPYLANHSWLNSGWNEWSGATATLANQARSKLHLNENGGTAQIISVIWGWGSATSKYDLQSWYEDNPGRWYDGSAYSWAGVYGYNSAHAPIYRTYVLGMKVPTANKIVNGENVIISEGSCSYPTVRTAPLYCFYNYSGYGQWTGNKTPSTVAGPNTGSSLVASGGVWTSTPHIHTGSANAPAGSINWWQPASGNTAGVLGFSRSADVSPYGYVSKVNGAGGTYDPWYGGFWNDSNVHSSPTYATGYDTATPWQNNDCDTYRSEVLTYTIPGTSSLDDSRITSLGYYALTAQWQSDTFRQVIWSSGGRTLMNHWDLMSRNDINSNSNYYVRSCNPALNNAAGTGNLASLVNSISGLSNPFSVGACGGAGPDSPGTSHWQCELTSPTIAGTYAAAVADAVRTNSPQAQTWADEGWNSSNTDPLWLSSTVTSRDNSIIPVTFSQVRIMDYNAPDPSQPPIDVTSGTQGYALSFTQPVNAANISGAAPGIYYATRVASGSTPYNSKVDINDKAQFFHFWANAAGSTQEPLNDPTRYPANGNLSKWLSFVWDSDYNWGTNENRPFVIQRTYTIRGWFKLTDSGSLGSGTGSVAVGSGGEYWYYGEAPCLDYNQTDGTNPENYGVNADGTWRSNGILASSSNQIYVTRGQNNADNGKLPDGLTRGYPANPVSYSPPSPLGTGEEIGGANGPGFGVNQNMPASNDVLFWNAIACPAGAPQYQVRLVLHNQALSDPLVANDGISTSGDGLKVSFSIPTTSEWWSYGAKLGFQVRARCGFDTGQAGNWGEWSPSASNGYVYTTMVPKPTGSFNISLASGKDNQVVWANSDIECLAGSTQYKAVYTTQDSRAGTTVLANWGTVTTATINDPTYKGAVNGITVSARCHIEGVSDITANEIVSSEFKWTPESTWTINTHAAAWQNQVYAGGAALHVIAYCSASPGAANSAVAVAPQTRINWSASVWSALGWEVGTGARTDQTTGTGVISAPTSVLNIGNPYSGYSFSASCSRA